ncbi:PaaI family thioesterase [Macrococcus carouselicus]|uniref:PaaI family thioesterase n=1 Tax=Macrococcus carouselicus TaxID=69969 RepID=A0A9Q8CP37_9STAP|nr:PaaI family thioesterase [Macrococcus carouselicus]TDM04711.1 PaaI family thioesterase [Macrococcus carouselicus]
MLSNFEMKLEERLPGKLCISMPVTDKVRQPFGYLHGGATIALCETAASLGSADLIDLKTTLAFGLEVNANHIASVREGRVFAHAVILHEGQSTHVWEVRVIAEDKRLLSISRATIAIREKR